jgi:hypothetical protein
MSRMYSLPRSLLTVMLLLKIFVHIMHVLQLVSRTLSYMYLTYPPPVPVPVPVPPAWHPGSADRAPTLTRCNPTNTESTADTTMEIRVLALGEHFTHVIDVPPRRLSPAAAAPLYRFCINNLISEVTMHLNLLYELHGELSCTSATS